MAIGYACITVGVPGTGLSRCILKNATEDNIKRITVSNLRALETMIEYMFQKGIQLFRISSDIIPFGSHKVNTVLWWKEYQELFEIIGTKITQAGIRVSMHPGQYTVLNSPEHNIIEHAVKDLEYHDRFLYALGMDEQSKIVLHIGGVYGNKDKAAKAFIENYFLLPPSVKQRLVIENDDKNYTIQDVLFISKETGAPVIFDNLHHKINPPLQSVEEGQWIKACANTWKVKDGKQKIHYSQQRQGEKPGAHSETIFCQDFLTFYDNLPHREIDIMLEVKDKNLSAVKCFNLTNIPFSHERLNEDWERYRYFISSRSNHLYREIEMILREEPADTGKRFYKNIEQAYMQPENMMQEVKTAVLIWDRFLKQESSTAEMRRFEKLLYAYENHTGRIKELKNHLLKCAIKRNMTDLICSLYFYIDN